MQRWSHKNAGPNRPPEALPVEDSSSSSSVDPFLLDFGTSVNVTEDLHCEIRAGIQEIDAKIQKGLNANKQEERVGGQLQQDLSHAHCEMRNLSRGAADRLDDAGVHESFLNGLETTLQADLVTATGPVPGCRSPVSVVDADDAENVPPTNAASEKFSKQKTNKQVLKEKKDIVKKLVQSLQQQSKVGDTRHREKETLLQQKRQIEETIQTGGLESIVEQSKQKNEHAQVDVKNESHRQQHLKEKMQSVRGRCGAHAQQLADKTKQVNAVRNQNAAEQERCSQQVAAASTKVAQQKSVLADAKSRHALMASRSEQVQQELVEYQIFCEARDATKETLEKEEQEQQELVRLMEALTMEHEVVVKELEETKESLGNAQNLHAGAMQKKAANDEKEASEYLPGQEELVKLAEEKERLASKIRDQHSKMVQVQAHEKEALASKTEVKNQVTEKLAALQQELEEKRNDTSTRTSAEKVSKEALEREIQDNHDLEEKLRLAYETDMARIQEMDENHKANAKKKMEQAKAKAQYEIIGQERYLHISLHGAEVIDNAKDTEQKLNEELFM